MSKFRSDAIFNGNVDIADTLTVQQISEKNEILSLVSCKFSNQLFWTDYEPSSGEPNIGENTTGYGLWQTFKTSELNPKILDNSEIISCVINNLDIESCIATFSKDKKFFNINIILKEQNQLNVKIDFILYYTAAPKMYSYSNRPKLYGKDGSLYDIDKRLENLENNFKAIDYERSTEGVDITNNNLIIDISEEKLILEKSNYEIQGTNVKDVVEILNDINSRLEGLGV